MKIIFMGTPDFAIPSLQILLESNHSVLAVVSAPDKERGRGRDISSTPLKKFALSSNLKVYTPVRLNDEDFLTEMRNLKPDLFVVVAFRILPKELYTIPEYGSINLHGSLLPKYRGAAPIQWSIIQGDKETGLTTFFLEDKVDTGNILLQKSVPIEDNDDFGTLHDKMMITGADLLLKTVNLIESGEVVTRKQENEISTPAPKIVKETCEIQWNKSGIEIHNLVRGLSPLPGAFFIHNGSIIKIFKTGLVADISGIEKENTISISVSSLRGDNSEIIVYQTKKEIYFETGSGIIQVLELQPEGRKRMTAKEFLRGYRFPLPIKT